MSKEWIVRKHGTYGSNWCICDTKKQSGRRQFINNEGREQDHLGDYNLRLFPTQSAAQEALDKYLGKENQVKAETEVAYSDLVVGREYRIEVKPDSNKGDISYRWVDGIYTIKHKHLEHFTIEELSKAGDIFFSASRKFYTPGSTEPQEKEQDMKVVKLYTTAIVKRAKPEEGKRLGKVIEAKDFQVKVAETLQDAIAERIDSNEKLKTSDVAGKVTEFSLI